MAPPPEAGLSLEPHIILQPEPRSFFCSAHARDHNGQRRRRDRVLVRR